jgi:hypothetical protein
MFRPFPLIVGLLCACQTPKSDDTGGDSGNLPGADGGDGGGADGGGSGGGSNIDCDETPEDPGYNEATCASDELVCGGTIEASNAGEAMSQLDGSNYSSYWACQVVGSGSYLGPERYFEFTHPGDGNVRVSLDSPCGDLDLFVLRWQDGCVRDDYPVQECEGEVGRGGGSITIWNNEPARYLVIVDGPEGSLDPYAVSLDCG